MLRQYLYKNYYTDSEKTHVWFSGGKYNITNIEDFYKRYEEAYHNDEELEIIEMQLKDGRNLMVIDIDFRQNNIDRIYDKKYLCHLIKLYCEAIKKYVDCSEEELECLVFERSEPYVKDNVIKDGIHLIFHKLRLKYEVLYGIRQYMIENVERIGNLNSVEDMIDKSVIKSNGWFMYGSGKSKTKRYKLTYMHVNNNLAPLKDEIDLIVLIKTLSIRKEIESPSLTDEGEKLLVSKSEKKIKKKVKIENNKLLSRILYIWSNNEYSSWFLVGAVIYNEGYDIEMWKDWSKTSNKYLEGCCEKEWIKFVRYEGNKICIGGLLVKTKELYPKEYKKMISEKEIKEIIVGYYYKMELEDTLKQTVVSMRHCFPKNDLIIDNEDIKEITDDGEKYYSLGLLDKYCPIQKKKDNNTELRADIWQNGMQLRSLESHIFNKRYPDVPVPIPEKYKNMIFVKVDKIEVNNNNYYGEEKSELIDFEDDMHMIRIFEDDDSNYVFLNSLNGTHYDIAKVIYNLYNENFKCIGIKGEWYEFRDNRWRKGSMRLRQNISEELVIYYKKARKEYKKIDNIEKKKVLAIEDLIKRLKTTGFKNNIMSEANEIFYNNLDGFLNRLDEDRNLIGFDDGVYDLKKMEFRKGRREDYITMSVGYKYRSEYSENIDNIRQFIEDIIPDYDNREYLLTYLASCLSGHNPEELFHIFSGNTRNGKSKLRDLIMYTFGEYYTTLSSNLLTTERPSPSNPQPNIMRLKGKRIIIASEPEANKKINTSFMKFMTGNDPIKGRGLYEKEEYEYKPQFKMMVLCNDIPKMDSNDGGVWSRSRCIEFPTTFVENPIAENEKKINKGLSDILIHWKEDFMLLLIEYYKKYIEQGLKVTKAIKDYTKKYQKENDIYYEYLDERTVESDKNIHTKELYKDFYEWHTKRYEEKVPTNRAFIKGIRKYKNVEDKVKIIGGYSTTGIKKLELIQ